MDQLAKNVLKISFIRESWSCYCHQTLQDMGMLTDEDESLVTDPSKLRRERERCREEICQEEVFNFKFVTGLYFDGRKNVTQIIVVEGPNRKMCRSTQLEEHDVLVGKPGTYYLTHFSQLMAKAVHYLKKYLSLYRKQYCVKNSPLSVLMESY